MTIKTNEGEVEFHIDQESDTGIDPELKIETKKDMKKIQETKKEKEAVIDPLWLDKKSFRFTLMAIFAALVVVLGYLLVYIPNIQLVFVMLFLTGFIMGKKDGAAIGLMGSFLFCFFNPLGASPLPLLAFQIVYYSCIAIMGASIHSLLKNKEYFKPKEDLYVLKVLILFGSLGGLLTFLYDVLTTVIHALVFFGTLKAFWPTYLIGITFTTVHLISNILIFVFVLPALIQTCYKMLDL